MGSPDCGRSLLIGTLLERAELSYELSFRRLVEKGGVGPVKLSGKEVSKAGGRGATPPPWNGRAWLKFTARGVMYVLIAVIVLHVAFGERGRADRGGAFGEVARTRFGAVLLCALVIGFAGIAPWRFSEAAFG